MPNKSRELEIAIFAATEAGKVLEKYFEVEISHDMKDDKSIMTAADSESEEVIKKIISEAYPEHSILAEETGLTQNGHEYKWHVDPIDGTRNFARGIPFFGISIALEHKKEIVLGVVYNPLLKFLFYGEVGKGAYFNNKLMHVSKYDNKKCIVTVSSGRSNDALKLRRALLHNLPDKAIASVRDFGCTVLDLVNVARGATEGDIKLGLRTYDVAAGILLVREAGGKVTNMEGEEWSIKDDGAFIASNGIFHDLLVSEVKKEKAKLNLP